MLCCGSIGLSHAFGINGGVSRQFTVAGCHLVGTVALFGGLADGSSGRSRFQFPRPTKNVLFQASTGFALDGGIAPSCQREGKTNEITGQFFEPRTSFMVADLRLQPQPLQNLDWQIVPSHNRQSHYRPTFGPRQKSLGASFSRLHSDPF